MLGLMVLTSYDILSEHNLLTPDSEVKNIAIISLLILEFLCDWATDLDCTWGCELVRLCDEAGIKLDEHVRKQVSISKKQIAEYRAEYKKKKEASEYGQDEEDDGEEHFHAGLADGGFGAEAAAGDFVFIGRPPIMGGRPLDGLGVFKHEAQHLPDTVGNKEQLLEIVRRILRGYSQT